ncbi:MAG: RNA polymerase factor sigma-54 [Bacteroidaceae bacterium]|nr:RNA polymerase factor sigma-54 [Bacteroidaceae bacterium]
MTKSSNTQTQHQEQLLSQTLSPQQLLAVQLLEMTTVEIEERVRGEVMDNPVLEAMERDETPGDEAPMPDGDSMSADELDDYSGNEEIPVAHAYSGTEMPLGDTLSFGDTLMEQLGELSLTPVQQAVGEYIIGSLDEDGLLRKSLSEIADELLVYNSLDVSEDDVLKVLGMIQTFEPAGIAARSLQECLMLQLERNGAERDMTLQKRIVSDYYDDFTGKRWGQLAEKLGVADDECREAIADIVRLNPRPGASLTESIGFSRQQITPDFLLDVQDDEVYVSLNNAHIPSLKVSDEYMQMLEEQSLSSNSEQRAAAQFLRQKIDAARSFVTAVQQRERTMLSTMRAIVKMQKPFFVSGGDEAMLKPMILEDIAKMTGHDVSTISRVGNSKYVQTPWSIYPLKYFFSDGIVKDDGTEQSVYELFRVLRELVDEEDKQNPLTDQALQEALQERGYNVARRTVAKYREQLGIPVARLRRE